MIAWVLCLVLATLLLATLVASYHLHRELSDAVENEKAQHEACHEMTLDALKNASLRTDAAVLMSAADAWDSIEEKPNLARLAREVYRPGGPSMPTIWMKDRANKMFEEKIDPDNAPPVYNLSGERVL